MASNISEPRNETDYYGKYFQRLFLSLTEISDAKNKNHPQWDQKIIVISLFRNNRGQKSADLVISEPRNNSSSSDLSELGLFDHWILPRTKYHMSPLPILYLV